MVESRQIDFGEKQINWRRAAKGLRKSVYPSLSEHGDSTQQRFQRPEKQTIWRHFSPPPTTRPPPPPVRQQTHVLWYWRARVSATAKSRVQGLEWIRHLCTRQTAPHFKQVAWFCEFRLGGSRVSCQPQRNISLPAYPHGHAPPSLPSDSLTL